MQVGDNDLMVSCQFDSSALLGYLVMVQFAGNPLTLLANETRADSGVTFEGVAYGLHNVVVFPLTENGLIGTHVAYTEQVTVMPSTTTAMLTTTHMTPTMTDSPPSTSTGTLTATSTLMLPLKGLTLLILFL